MSSQFTSGLVQPEQQEQQEQQQLPSEDEPGKAEYYDVFPNIWCSHKCKGFMLILYYITGGYITLVSSFIGLNLISIFSMILAPCRICHVVAKAKLIMKAELNPTRAKYRWLTAEMATERCETMYFNILWNILSIFLGIFHLFISIFLCLTIIFLPLGLTHYSLCQINLFPFNVDVVISPSCCNKPSQENGEISDV